MAMLDRDLMVAALPGYELAQELGRGASGVVVAAKHVALDRTVAIKLLPRAFAADEEASNRFVAEARLVAQLDHPHIVKVFDYVASEGLRLIVMEYLSGGSLWDRFTAENLDSHQACALTIGVCAGLERAHRSGIVHRDMKPENVLLAEDGTPRVSDFGIAKANSGDSKLTMAGTVLGTPAYMAPEQAIGAPLGPQCDIYALGTMLYELLSGRVPFHDSDSPAAMLHAQVNTPPPELSEVAGDVPPELAQVVMRALEKDPGDRQRSAEELGVQLARAAARVYGHGWLAHSGVPLRESGPIADAALEGPERSLRAPSIVGRVREHEVVEVGDDATDLRHLGIDFGTTNTAVAIHRRGTAHVLHLGNRSAVAPSTVFVDTDGTMHFGDIAARRLIADPSSVVTGFKRRIGDPTEIDVGGSTVTPLDLTAGLMEWVLRQTHDMEDVEPDHVTVSHPANWTSFKKDLLSEALRRVTTAPTSLITEPQAAAVYYASQERVENGAVVVVYDLGGGTFDTAVLRKTDGGFEFLGRPEGIERLGGIDFDDALFHHVARRLDGAPLQLDPSDPNHRTALAFLRRECTEAKEALSTDTEARISVMLPNVHCDLVVTRAELEGLIRPTLLDTLSVLRASMASAAVGASDVTAVLTVGGSSRIPLVSELIAESVSIPVAIDVHPKHCVALGAAISEVGGTTQPRVQPVGSGGSIGRPAADGDGASAELQAFSMPTRPPPETVAPDVGRTQVAPPEVVGHETMAPNDVVGRETVAPQWHREQPSPLPGASAAESPSPGSSPPAVSGPGAHDPRVRSGSTWIRKRWWIPVLATAVVAVVVALVMAGGGDSEDPILAVRLTGGNIDTAGRITVDYVTENFEPSIDPDDPDAFHLHFFWDVHDPAAVGTNVAPGERGQFVEWDTSASGELVFDGFTRDDMPAGASAICAIVATNSHAVLQPQLVAVTGSCIAVSS